MITEAGTVICELCIRTPICRVCSSQQFVIFKVVTILYCCSLNRSRFLRCAVGKTRLLVSSSNQLCSKCLSDYHSWWNHHCLELWDQIIISLEWRWVCVFSWSQIISRITIIVLLGVLFICDLRVSSMRAVVNGGYHQWVLRGHEHRVMMMMILTRRVYRIHLYLCVLEVCVSVMTMCKYVTNNMLLNS